MKAIITEKTLARKLNVPVGSIVDTAEIKDENLRRIVEAKQTSFNTSEYVEPTAGSDLVQALEQTDFKAIRRATRRKDW